MKLLLSGLLAAGIIVPSVLYTPNPTTAPMRGDIGRIAITHDGNYHDKDDIGAAAMMQALIWKAGVQGNLVHFDHSNHRGASDAEQHADMVISSNRALFLYEIDRKVVFDDLELDGRSSATSLAAQIDASSEDDILTILQAGPWEMMCFAFDISDPDKHQYVKIISHSNWNDNHEHFAWHRNKDDFFEQYDDGGRFEGHTPPAYQKILDQNWFAFRSDLEDWEWMTGDISTFFVLWRTSESGFAQGDMSDAGMLFWLLTGIEDPTMAQVRDFFEL